MLSKNQLKLITSLQQKKYRKKHGLFIAEGIKTVREFLNANFHCDMLFCTEDYIDKTKVDQVTLISESELKKISALKTPNKVLGIFQLPSENTFRDEGLIVALDGVNDPGNLGTIIRLCDWFGVPQLLCSKDTVDCYNQKVVQSTMGSLARIAVFYCDLEAVLSASSLPIYGAVMQGNNVHKTALHKDAIVVLGNEANGISKTIEKLVNHHITIPRFGKIQQTESLNVATATAILLNEFRRPS